VCQANNLATYTIQEAHNQGLSSLYKSLEVDGQDQRLSCDYILTLTDTEPNLLIDFEPANAVITEDGHVSMGAAGFVQ
jgi:hypothetical protein